MKVLVNDYNTRTVTPWFECECHNKFCVVYPLKKKKKKIRHSQFSFSNNCILRFVFFPSKQQKAADTHVVGDLQHRQNEEDVLLSVEQLLVLEVSVHLGISQRELGRQLAEIRRNIRLGLHLPTEAKSATRSVDFSQQL